MRFATKGLPDEDASCAAARSTTIETTRVVRTATTTILKTVTTTSVFVCASFHIITCLPEMQPGYGLVAEAFLMARAKPWLIPRGEPNIKKPRGLS